MTAHNKQQILQALDDLPENASVEQAIERLCLLARLEGDGPRSAVSGTLVRDAGATEVRIGATAFTFSVVAFVMATSCSQSEFVADAAVAFDAAHLDASVALPGDAAFGVDLDFPVAGRRLSSDFVNVIGLTADHYAVVQSVPPMRVETISLIDGSRQLVDANGGDGITVDGKALFLWENCQQCGASPLVAWSARSGPVRLADRSPSFLAHASADGEWAYFLELEPGSKESGLVVASRLDGSGRWVVSTSVELTERCFPLARFVGHSLVVSRCESVVDAGAGRRDLIVADCNTRQTRTIFQGLNARPLSFEPSGGRVFVADDGGTGWLVPLDGSAPVRVDYGVVDGTYLPQGTAVVYQNFVGAMKKFSTVGNQPPVVLLAGGGGQLLLLPADFMLRSHDFLLKAQPAYQRHGISSDGKWIYYSHGNPTDAQCADLQLASTDAIGRNVTLLSDATGLIAGDPFSADGRFAIFQDRCLPLLSPGGGFWGTVEAWDSQSGSVERIAASGRFTWASRGAAVVFGDRLQEQSVWRGTMDLYLSDLSGQKGNRIAIAPQVESEFLVDPGLAKVVFAIRRAKDQGVYVWDIP